MAVVAVGVLVVVVVVESLLPTRRHCGCDDLPDDDGGSRSSQGLGSNNNRVITSFVQFVGFNCLLFVFAALFAVVVPFRK